MTIVENVSRNISLYKRDETYIKLHTNICILHECKIALQFVLDTIKLFSHIQCV